ncbi:MAG: alpha-amylase family glycosyl hydrolase [Cyanobacteria bacterium J06641_5]
MHYFFCWFLSLALAWFVAIAPVAAAEDQIHAYPPARGNLANDVLYYIEVDRFFDGEPENNVPTYDFPYEDGMSHHDLAYRDMNRFLSEHSYDPTHRYIGMYWGGDLEGVIQKLDYLQDLGVTKIVLSPIQDNTNGLLYAPGSWSYVFMEPDEDEAGLDPFYAHASSSYHGYWTKDWFEIDEHFRNPADGLLGERDRYRVFRRLLNAADKRGIGVILDLTLNHTSPFNYSSLHPSFYPQEIGFWFADNGAIYRHGEKVVTYWDPATGQLDPEGWFHPLNGIDFNRATPTEIENGTLPGGLPDLAQEKPEVADYLLDAVEFWLNFNKGQGAQIAGFRLDAVKHVNIHFWQQLEERVQAVRPDGDAILIGEYFSAGYNNRGSVDWYEKTNSYSLFNFGLGMPARRFFARQRGWDGRVEVLREMVLGRQGRYYNYPAPIRWLHRLFDPSETMEIPKHSLDVVSDEDALGWVTFGENHDEPRLLTQYPEMSLAAYDSLMKFTMVAPGVPMIMYGTETALAVPYHPKHKGLFGIGGDPFDRQMMIWPGAAGWKENLYQTTRSLAHLRQDYPEVLRYGKSSFIDPPRAKRNEDIFMVREPRNCEPGSPCPRVLYAYSTNGGNYSLDLAKAFDCDSFASYANVETNQALNLTDGLLALRLEPEESRVFLFP